MSIKGKGYSVSFAQELETQMAFDVKIGTDNVSLFIREDREFVLENENRRSENSVTVPIEEARDYFAEMLKYMDGRIKLLREKKD